MKTEAIYTALALLFAGNTFAQGQVTIHKKDGTTLTYPLTAVDTLSDNETSHHMTLSYSKQEGLLEPAQVIKASEVNLKQADQPQSFNLLQSITISRQEGSDLKRDIRIDVKHSTITLVLPNIIDRSNLKLGFETTGSYLYLNGKSIESGAKCDLSEQAEIKVVAFNGEIRTYQLAVINAGLPTMECTTTNSINGDWESASIVIKDEKGKSSFSSSKVKIKGKGSHYKENLKNSYNIKFDQKSALLGMNAGKRWVLLANAYDKSLIRSSVAFDIASKYLGFDWTPQCKEVELIVNGEYKGCYTLVEQIRVADGRVPSGTILSLEEGVSPDEDHFQAKESGLTFVMRDPETGVAGTQLLRSQRIIDDMERAMKAGDNDYLKNIDIPNFASWFLFNELVKNEEAMSSDGYLTLSEEGKLSMGPIWEMSKTMGGEYGDSYKNSVLEDSYWFSHLLKNENFKKSLSQQLEKLADAESEILSLVQERAKSIRYGIACNENIWHNLGATSEDWEAISPLFEMEIEKVVNWLNNRISWIKNNLKY